MKDVFYIKGNLIYTKGDVEVDIAIHELSLEELISFDKNVLYYIDIYQNLNGTVNWLMYEFYRPNTKPTFITYEIMKKAVMWNKRRLDELIGLREGSLVSDYLWNKVSHDWLGEMHVIRFSNSDKHLTLLAGQLRVHENSKDLRLHLQNFYGLTILHPLKVYDFPRTSEAKLY